jgi:hypothetical protein
MEAKSKFFPSANRAFSMAYASNPGGGDVRDLQPALNRQLTLKDGGAPRSYGRNPALRQYLHLSRAFCLSQEIVALSDAPPRRRLATSGNDDPIRLQLALGPNQSSDRLSDVANDRRNRIRPPAMSTVVVGNGRFTSTPAACFGQPLPQKSSSRYRRRIWANTGAKRRIRLSRRDWAHQLCRTKKRILLLRK